MAPQKERVYRFSLYVRKRVDMTDEQFNAHWSTSHPPLVQEWMVKYGILRYVQYHTPKSLKESTLQAWPDLKGLKVQDWDGVVEVTVRRIEDFMAAREDEFYERVVVPDEEKMIQRDKSEWTMGWEEVYVEGGKVVNSEEHG